MLNYIWAGLIVSSLVFALGYDIRDLATDPYRNDQALALELAFPEGYEPGARRVPVAIRIDSAGYGAFYDTEARPAPSYPGTLVQTREGVQLRFDVDATLPEPLATIQGVSQSDVGALQGTLLDFVPPQPAAGVGATVAGGAPAIDASVVFESVRFVKMNAIAAAALDFAETAAELALSLIGVLALFLGLLKIAEDAGVIYAMVRVVRPVLRPIFPEIPPDHPALAMIALNMAANMFGLGNAATPFGLRAMEELQTLNPSDDTATNSMVMLLAINTASVQLVPPVLLLAILGLQVNQLIFAILITTFLGLVVAIIAARIYGKIPAWRSSDPGQLPPPDAPPPAVAARG